MGAGGVEVAERGGFLGGVCDAEVFYDVFAGDFCAAVGVGRATGTDFWGNSHQFRLTSGVIRGGP